MKNEYQCLSCENQWDDEGPYIITTQWSGKSRVNQLPQACPKCNGIYVKWINYGYLENR